MKYLRRFVCTFALLCFVVSSGEAQTTDWPGVKNLPVGSIISVRSRHRVKCIFVHATNDELVCQPIRPGLIGLTAIGRSEFRFAFRRVREVRLEYSDGSNAAVGATIGAGAGAAFGAIRPSTDLVPSASIAFGIAFGALVGGFFGVIVPFRHGAVIYKK
jgi:hypothetical protein